MKVYEMNIDGLVGPNHHYAGLAAGNIASLSNALSIANPAAAALQGIQKMRLLHELGFKQAVLPPHPRPNLTLLYQLGFSGSPKEILKEAQRISPALLGACYSASSMWAANAATIAPSQDSQDQKIHFTAANLISNLHRHQETDFSHFLFRKIFANSQYFTHHTPLPRTTLLGDEGAANHNRLCENHGKGGVHLFVYGKKGLPIGNPFPSPKRYPARQTFEASASIARLHQLMPNQCIFAAQNPEAIDKGVFHNDVISVANENLFLFHEKAFLNTNDVLKELSAKCNFPIKMICVKNSELTIAKAVQTYLFNSQLLTLPNTDSQKMILISPIECQASAKTRSLILRWIADSDNPITNVYYMDLKQSMLNGGGPACLRLRVVINEEELQAMHQGVLVTSSLLSTLEKWVHKHYRQTLHASDLTDVNFMNECFTALDELTQILELGPIYPFQN